MTTKIQDQGRFKENLKEFSKAGFDVPPPPEAGLPSDMYEQAALRFLGSIFKNKEIIENK